MADVAKSTDERIALALERIADAQENLADAQERIADAVEGLREFLEDISFEETAFRSGRRFLRVQIYSD